MLSTECWLLSSECWVLSIEYWVLSAECWLQSAACWVLSAECLLQQSTDVRGKQVFLQQLVCQERKPHINGWFPSLVHLLGQNIHWYSPKTEAINWLSHGMTILAVIKFKILSTKWGVISADCWALSAECCVSFWMSVCAIGCRFFKASHWP